MTEPLTVGRYAAYGAFTSASILCAFVVGIQSLDFLRRLEWKDDVTRLQKTRTTPVYVAKYLYYETDWREVGRLLAYSIPFGALVGFVASIFYVGLVEVFL